MDVAPSLPPPASPEFPPAVRRAKRPLSRVEGFVILGGTMVGLVALSSYLVGKLEKTKAKFMVAIISQIFGIGIAGLGAPLFGPVSSKFTQRAFGISRDGESFEGHNPTDLEKLWWRSQEHYSVNANMARNVVSHFLVSIQNNIAFAYQALRRGGEEEYAAARVAEAALRLRTLFAEIDADDWIVATSVRAALTQHLPEEQLRDLRCRITEQLEGLDAYFDEPGVRDYYDRLLDSWLPV